MICADLLAGANLENENPEFRLLGLSIRRPFFFASAHVASSLTGRFPAFLGYKSFRPAPGPALRPAPEALNYRPSVPNGCPELSLDEFVCVNFVSPVKVLVAGGAGYSFCSIKKSSPPW